VSGAVDVYVEEHGHGDPTLLLLHGFGATGAVWRRVIAELDGVWSGRVVVCDLPGHGRSAPLPAYTYDAMAAAVGRVIPAGGSLAVLGHSFGGFVGVVLASGRYGVEPLGVVGAGVKVTWPPEDVAGFTALASKPVRWFATRDEAEARYRTTSGLTPDVTDDRGDLARGVVEVGGRFRLSHDMAAFGIDPPDVRPALDAARCEVLLCRGERDEMVTDAQSRALGVETLDIPDAGHNVHVEQPQRLVGALVDFVGRA
jgi:pimeloyl-ACP methyl ester carboxylesterase